MQIRQSYAPSYTLSGVVGLTLEAHMQCRAAVRFHHPNLIFDQSSGACRIQCCSELLAFFRWLSSLESGRFVAGMAHAARDAGVARLFRCCCRVAWSVGDIHSFFRSAMSHPKLGVLTPPPIENCMTLDAAAGTNPVTHTGKLYKCSISGG